MPINAHDIATKARITWCPGCPNAQILLAYRQAVSELANEGIVPLENMTAFAGIGCHGKISDYINVNTFTSLHGRLVPSMTGAKCANPNLCVVGFSGDGDSFDEGLEHVVHAAKRNSDIKLFIHENQVFALTTGQSNAVSPKGHKGRATPFGSIEEPMNALLLMLASGATFVARAAAHDIQTTKKIMRAAIAHKGFSFVEIIQPCITFFDTRDYFKDVLTPLDPSHPTDNLRIAMETVQPWGNGKIPVGIFYDVRKPTFEEELHG
jgi:2-oxoglutarate ferredoxin oxidoreductase subunit beta